MLFAFCRKGKLVTIKGADKGIAFGFDRIAMLMSGSQQIRDVIAFPKTTSAMSLMDSSPSNVDNIQLDELGLEIKNKK